MRKLYSNLLATVALLLFSVTAFAQSDNCSPATTYNTLCVPVAGNNIGATTGPEDSYAAADICAVSVENTVWYTFTAPVADTYTFTMTVGACAPFNSGLQTGILTGPCGGPYTSLNCSFMFANATTSYSVALGAGQQVWFVVDGDGGDECPWMFDICGSACNADAGTITVLEDGVPAASPLYICANTTNCIDFVSNNDFTLPPAQPGEIAELMYALYTCPPTTGDPATDPCYSGSLWTAQDFTDCNPSTYGLTGTYWFAPITADDGDNGGNPNGVIHWDQNGDACFDQGPAIELTYLNPITFGTPAENCYNGNVTIQINGGMPEVDGSNYTITNTGSGTIAAYPVSHGQSVTITGLTNGQSYSISVTDSEGCTFTFAGGPYTACACPTIDFTGLPATLSCEDAAVNLVADQTGFPVGAAITPCYYVQVFPTNAQAGNSMTFFENAVNIGCFGPGAGCAGPIGANTNFSGYLSYVSPSATNTVDLCETTVGVDMTYAVFDCHSGALITSGTWTSDGLCQTINITPPPIDGISAFSGPGTTTTDWGLGSFDPAAAGPGTHTVTYSWDNENGCSGTASYNITVTNPHSAAFTYPQNTYCQGDTDPLPTITGDLGGQFTGDPGIVFTDGSPSNTGEIDLSASTAGGPYTITYTSPGTAPCNDVQTFNITINPDQTATITYPQNTYCADDLDPSPTIVGTGGGTFTGPAGVIFTDGSPSNTGEIDLSASTSTGTYTITYTTPGPCPGTATFDVTINALDDPSFSYPQNTYCESDADPSPTISGLGGGTFSGTAGLSIDPNSGVIDLSNSSTTGHTVTYLTNGPCPQSTTFNITINADDDPSFSYPSATFCVTGTDPTPTITGLSGGTFTGTGGIVFTDGSPSNTGEIDLSATGTGNFDVTYLTNGPCPQTQTVNISITLAPDASFSYNDPFCEGDPNNPLPSFPVGASAGTFSFTVVSGGPNLVFVNVNTGEIDLTQSDPGVYDITNFIPAAGGCASASSTFQITINAQDDPSFTYPQASYCQSETDPLATITGTNGGDFTATPGGLVFINTSTGEIDLSGSSTGTYVVQYATNGACPDSTTFNITINADEDPSFSYPQNNYCEDGTDPIPTIAGTPGGTFSGTGSMVIDQNSGVIDLDLSGAGTYTVTYVTPGPICQDSTTFAITIDPVDDASFSYTANAYCTLDPDPVPTITGLSGGQFTSTPAGLAVDLNTGVIDIANSSLGSYVVTYTTNGPCPASSTFNVDIVSQLDATITPAGPFCTNDPVFTMTAVNTGGNWTANCGGCINATTGDFDPNAAGAGLWEIIYTISGNCGDIDTTFVQVDLSADPTITNAPASVCEGSGDVDLDAVDAGGTWTGPGIIDAANGIWNPDSAGGAGVYTVYYTIAGNCAGVDSATITVNPLPGAPIATDESACAGDPVPDLSAAGGGGTFEWYDDPALTNLVGTGATFSTGQTAAGTYTYYVVEVLGGCMGPATPVTLTIGGPTAFFTASPTSGMAPLVVNFTNGSTGAISYDWDFGDGNTSTATDPSNTYNSFGQYDVTLTATDAAGCTDTYTYSFIDVDAESEMMVPNVFSPNQDLVNDVFKVHAENLTELNGTIFNRWGQVIYSWNTVDGGWDGYTTSGEEVPQGTYYYIITAVGADDVAYEFKGHVTLTR